MTAPTPPAPDGYLPQQTAPQVPQPYPQQTAPQAPQPYPQPMSQPSYTQPPFQQHQLQPQRLPPQPYPPQASLQPPPYDQPQAQPQAQAPAPLHGGLNWLLAVAGTLLAFLALSIFVASLAVIFFGATQNHAALADLNTYANVLSQIACALMGSLWLTALLREATRRPIVFKGDAAPRLLDQVNPRTTLRRPGRKLVLDLLALVAVGIALQMLLSSLLTIVDNLAPDSLSDYNDHMSQIISTTPLSFISLVILAPLNEELVFRGVALEFGRRSSPKPMVAIVASALAFGIAHLEPTQSLYTFFVGIIFAVIALRGGGIWASVCAHAALNLSSYFTDLLLGPFLQLGIAGLVLAIVLTAVATCLLLRQLLRAPAKALSMPS